MPYTLFDHTADLGLRMRADDLGGLFAEAAAALFAAIVANPETIRPVVTSTLQLEGTDREYLLFDWLAELLYRFDSEGLLGCRFDVQVDDTGLRATVAGEPVDRQRHELEREVKAITYHGLKVTEENGGWLAEVIVDI